MRFTPPEFLQAISHVHSEVHHTTRAWEAIPDSQRWKLLVIHCSATREGRHFDSSDIRRWHTSPPPIGRGWKQVGYSDIILLDGTVENLVPWNEDMRLDPWEVTNGVAGKNSVSRHVCYIGGCDSKGSPKDTRTTLQKVSLEIYVRNMLRINPFLKIAGHSNFANKACPSFNVQRWCSEIGVPEANIWRP